MQWLTLALLRNKFILFCVFILAFFVAMDIALSPNLHKNWISQQVKQHTGMNIVFGGIQFSLFRPWYLELEDVELQDSLQGLDGKLAGLTLRLAIWPLLEKNIEVERLQISGLALSIDSDKRNDTPPAGEKNKPDQPLPINRLLLHSITIENSTLALWVDGAKVQADDINLDLVHALVVDDGKVLDRSPEFQLQSSMALTYREFTLNSIALNANAEAGQVELETLSLSLDQEGAKGELDLSGQIDLANQFATRLSAEIRNLDILVDQQLLSKIGVHIQSSAADTEQQPTEIPTQIDPEINHAPDNQQEKAQVPIQSLVVESLLVEQSKVAVNLDATQAGMMIQSITAQALPLINDFMLAKPEFLATKHAALSADITQLYYLPYQVDSLAMKARLQDQMLSLPQLDVAAHGLDLGFGIQADLSAAELPARLTTNRSSIALDERHREWIKGEIWPKGGLQLDADLQVNLAEPETALSSLNGALKVTSNQLLLNGLNLNEILQSLEDSEKTSLLDVGSFLVTGPLGLIANQVANLGKGGLSASGGQTQFNAIAADIKIVQGVIQTQDVAFATDKFRSAFDGQFDLPNQSFKDMQFYLLDDQHCAMVQQTLNGRVDAPEGVAGALASTTVIKPFTNILNQAGSLISDCKPVYDGSVAHPAKE